MLHPSNVCRVIGRLSFLSLCMFVVAGVVQAQSVTATINGTVQDAAGAFIPEATVTAINQGNSLSTSSEIEYEWKLFVHWTSPAARIQ